MGKAETNAYKGPDRRSASLLSHTFEKIFFRIPDNRSSPRLALENIDIKRAGMSMASSSRSSNFWDFRPKGVLRTGMEE
ncbi:hypothetical protein DL89DRAFT_267766 [Linderina pennispora]|uniref:Uncharacterized protein n=1 Tax=Linderina pennispora TaxID=61395 RepID=A0A1Y1W7S6_9FUNG|nr:uncharacterized protein DL89DRAFT_267766 [Linderina pennispora]ORX69583.1 hypothetical protein DL89DRAFT_267766 [Linderina pennispora]